MTGVNKAKRRIELTAVGMALTAGSVCSLCFLLLFFAAAASYYNVGAMLIVFSGLILTLVFFVIPALLLINNPFKNKKKGIPFGILLFINWLISFISAWLLFSMFSWVVVIIFSYFTAVVILLLISFSMERQD